MLAVGEQIQDNSFTQKNVLASYLMIKAADRSRQSAAAGSITSRRHASLCRALAAFSIGMIRQERGRELYRVAHQDVIMEMERK